MLVLYLTLPAFNTIYSIHFNQHGFSRSRSTSTNLLVFKTGLVKKIENGGQVNAIYTNLKKVFDTVDFDLLINKLKLLGISDSLMSRFKSYLTCKAQLVKIKNTSSVPFKVTSGVP